MNKEWKELTLSDLNSRAFFLAKHFLFVLLWPKPLIELTLLAAKLTPDRWKLMLSVNREKTHLTLEVWEPRAGGTEPRSYFPYTDSLDGSSLLSFPRLSYLPFSQRVSLYPKPMWWAHVPEGPSAQSFTFSATHIVWPEMNRQGILAGKGLILPEGERELVVGYFRISWGFVGIPYGFVISSSWQLGDIRGESWAVGGVG